MNNKSNKMSSFYAILTCTVVMIFGNVTAFCQNNDNEKTIEYIVAKVNSAVITSTELDTAIDSFKTRLKNQPIDEEKLRKEALESLIIEKLVLTIAQIYKIEVPDDDINKRIEMIKKDNNIDTDEALDKTLKNQGMSLLWLKDQLKRGILYQRVILSNVYASITVSDEEISDYYNRNIKEFSSGDEVRVRQIFVSTSDKDDASALATINEALAKLKEGSDFISVLNQYADEKARTNDGDIGYFKKGELVGALEESAFKLTLGNFSDVIKSDNGYHIIQITERKIAKEIPLDSVRQSIADKIRQSKMEEASKEYIEKLKKDYFVEILDPSLKPKDENNPKGN